MSTEYPKIKTVFKRNPDDNYKTLMRGEFALPEFEYLADNTWVFTEKVDGTNVRVIINPEERSIEFKGKTDKAQLPAPLLTWLEGRFLHKALDLFEMFPNGACLYGEGYGAKIQKGGGNYLDHQAFVLFDVRVGRWWLERDAVEGIAQRVDIGVVPLIGIGTLHQMVKMTEWGFNSKWGDFLAEGIIARPPVELFSRAGHRVITKIKHTDFQ